MRQLVLDAGAFIAFERGDVETRALLAAAGRLGIRPVTTSPVVAQVWRDGRTPVVLARLLRGVEVRDPSERDARLAGEMLRRTRGSDVVDALVAGLVRDNDTVLTSDPADIQTLLSAAKVHGTVRAV